MKGINETNLIEFLRQCKKQSDRLYTGTDEYADSVECIEIRELVLLANEWFGIKYTESQNFGDYQIKTIG